MLDEGRREVEGSSEGYERGERNRERGTWQVFFALEMERASSGRERKGDRDR